VDWVSVVARVLLAGVFLVAAATKAVDQPGVRETLRAFRVPRGLIPAGAVLLPVAEVVVAGLLLPESTARYGGAGALALLLIFIAAVTSVLRRGEEVECHCFGQASSKPVGRHTLVRNWSLCVAAVAAIAASPPGLMDWIADRTAAEIVSLILGFGALVAAGLSIHWRSMIEPLEFELVRLRAQRAPGLEAGTPIPSVDVTRLSDGSDLTTQQALEHRDGVLVFISSSCLACEELLPHLSRWQRTLADQVPISVVASGEADELRRQIARHELDHVMLDETGVAQRAFRLAVTPSAVAVANDATIASATAAGLVEIEALVRQMSGAPFVPIS
jgi:hypothetical protein